MEPQLWAQVYDPTGSMLASTILAAIPIVVLGAIGIFEVKAHLAAASASRPHCWSRSSSSACRRAWR